MSQLFQLEDVNAQLTAAKKPSETYSVGDKGIGMEGTAPVKPLAELRARYYFPGMRHQNQWNVGMLDGHVASQKFYPLIGVNVDYVNFAWAPTQWNLF